MYAYILYLVQIG